MIYAQHIAAIKGYEDIIQFLMQKGAIINVTGKFFCLRLIFCV